MSASIADDVDSIAIQLRTSILPVSIADADDDSMHGAC